MKKRRPIPNPTKISSYFFQQLVSPGATTPDDRKERAQSEQTKRAAASVLSESFTPEGVAAFLQSRSEIERQHSEALEDVLDACWKRVEDIIERNKERRRVIEEDIPQVVAPTGTFTFWTPEGVEQYYSLKTLPVFASDEEGVRSDSNGFGTDNSNAMKSDRNGPAAADRAVISPQGRSAEDKVDGNAAAEGDGRTDPVAEFSSQRACGRAPIVSGAHHTKGRKLTDKELLDESKVPHCLRRLFASLLRRRNEFPKSTTLLFDAIQRTQSERFPEIEAVIEDVPFSMPLHRPFRCIAAFVARSFAENPKGEAPEQAFAATFKTVSKDLKTAYEKLHELKGYVHPVGERTDRAEVIYKTLLGELQGRKSLHETYGIDIEAIMKASAVELSVMEGALKECNETSRRLLATIEDQTAQFIADVHTSLDRREEAIEEIASFYKRDRDRLQSSLQRKIYRAKKSEELQEKCARRIREVTKELYIEQVNYEELLQEILAESLLLQQLDSSYTQLSSSLNNAASVHQESKISSIREALQRSEDVRVHLIEQCQFHINRLKKDEHYRLCRLATNAKDNALCWSRCLNDLSTIYETHFNSLNEKCRVSTQMRYLLSYEKDCVSRDLNQVQKEMEQLDSKWHEISTLLEELGEPVPPLSLLEKDPSCGELRHALTALALTRLVHGESSHLVRPEQWRERTVVATGDGSATANDMS
ncbi:uncharacterized protein TEOVI_000850800 [Trypanosoma equiperdum]|uniref:Paraflagellar rod protein n=1 Tax=Trypanosoma equiperdum TaxID=5694 RepID=A0A1G4I9U6_TRYEQ|nr:hypothetical protein, conserved [Trypanosoma equiperdum]